jgi:hypothetical protein
MGVDFGRGTWTNVRLAWYDWEKLHKTTTNLKMERVTLHKTLVTMYQTTLQNVPTQETTVRILNAIETSYLTGQRKQQTDKRCSTGDSTLQAQTQRINEPKSTGILKVKHGINFAGRLCYIYIRYYSQVSHRGGLGSIPGSFFILDVLTAVW